MSNIAIFRITRCSECIHYRFRYRIGHRDLYMFMEAECRQVPKYFQDTEFDHFIPDWCPFLEKKEIKNGDQVSNHPDVVDSNLIPQIKL